MRAISRPLAAAATAFAAALAGCADLMLDDATRTTQELLILPLQPSATPVAAVSFFAVNSRDVVRQLLHQEAAPPLYLLIRFPRGALASLDGAALGSNDSVRVTVAPAAGVYGLTLSPSGLALVRSAPPTATFEYARYGDLSVADGSPTYASRSSYAAALALWREVTPGLWQRVPGSGAATPDQVTGAVDATGTYLVAAPR